jgi:hypothetical protein
MPGCYRRTSWPKDGRLARARDAAGQPLLLTGGLCRQSALAAGLTG